MKHHLIILSIVALAACNSPTNLEAIELNKKAGDIYTRNLHNRDSMLYAIKLFDKAIAMDSTHLTPVGNKMNVLLSLKEYDQAISTGKKFLEKGQGHAEFYQFMGMVYDKIGMKDSANHYYKTSLKMFNERMKTDSNDFTLSSKLVTIVFLDSGKREKILVRLDSLIEQNPTNSTLLLTKETIQDFDREAFVNEIIR